MNRMIDLGIVECLDELTKLIERRRNEELVLVLIMGLGHEINPFRKKENSAPDIIRRLLNFNGGS